MRPMDMPVMVSYRSEIVMRESNVPMVLKARVLALLDLLAGKHPR